MPMPTQLRVRKAFAGWYMTADQLATELTEPSFVRDTSIGGSIVRSWEGQHSRI